MKTNATRRPALLRAAALAVFLATVVTWVATGAHLGWTQTTLTTLQHDEITGIDYPVHRSGFVTGVEVLAVGVATAAALATASYFSIRRAVRA